MYSSRQFYCVSSDVSRALVTDTLRDNACEYRWFATADGTMYVICRDCNLQRLLNDSEAVVKIERREYYGTCPKGVMGGSGHNGKHDVHWVKDVPEERLLPAIVI